jgi:SRSO17 transposase
VASRFSAFIDGLMSVIGHAARAKPLRDYCTGLMMLAIARALSRWRR